MRQGLPVYLQIVFRSSQCTADCGQGASKFNSHAMPVAKRVLLLRAPHACASASCSGLSINFKLGHTAIVHRMIDPITYRRKSL